MKHIVFKVMPALLFLALFSPPLAAQTTTEAVAGAVTDAIFSKEEKRIIKDYIKRASGFPGDTSEDEKHKGKGNKKKHGKGKAGKGKNKQLPPGLAKRKDLPPGLQRQLERRHTLPPGLAVRELPDDLAALLPAVKKGTDRIVVEDDIVLIEKATGRILDIILGRGTEK